MQLPRPPCDREKYLYDNPNKSAFYLCAVISTALLLTGSTLFAIHKPGFIWYLAFVLFTAFYLGIGYVIGIFSKPFIFFAHYELLRRTGYSILGKPMVDVFLPSCGEPIEVLKNTFKWVSKLDWDSNSLNVYVLDDSKDPARAVYNLAMDFGFHYISRPNKGELKKAGNIRHAFSQTYGEYIVIFDADFCPRYDFLTETIPWMMQEPDIGIVQTPQYFAVDHRMGWVEKGAAVIQELFYRLIQVNRGYWKAPICVGTNAVYRRRALAPFGGTYKIEHSEDVHTGFNLMAHGWEVFYLPVNLAAGLCPSSINSFFTQQYRWCMGSVSLLFNRELFWKTKLTKMQRLSFLSGQLYYIATALAVLVTPLPGLFMVYFSPEHVFWYNAIFSVPSFFFSIIFMAKWNKSPYGLSVLRVRQISYYAHLFALKDKMMGSVMAWVPTGNVGNSGNSKARNFKLTLIYYNMILCAVGFYGVGMQMSGLADYNFYPFIFFLSFGTWLNLTSLAE